MMCTSVRAEFPANVPHNLEKVKVQQKTESGEQLKLKMTKQLQHAFKMIYLISKTFIAAAVHRIFAYFGSFVFCNILQCFAILGCCNVSWLGSYV